MQQKQHICNAARHVSGVTRPSELPATAPDLTNRKPNYMVDFLAPTPSHLLHQSLADFLPPSCLQYIKNKYGFPTVLAPGHHLVYFPPQLSNKTLPKLLPDGTDTLHSPGEPWVRRMWAGGSITFPVDGEFTLGRQLRGRITETITDTYTKGDNERYYVIIDREVDFYKAPKGLREERHLVFMKQKSPEAAKEDAAKPAKFLKRKANYLACKRPANSL